MIEARIRWLLAVLHVNVVLISTTLWRAGIEVFLSTFIVSFLLKLGPPSPGSVVDRAAIVKVQIFTLFIGNPRGVVDSAESDGS